jgi:hypothetical protein
MGKQLLKLLFAGVIICWFATLHAFAQQPVTLSDTATHHPFAYGEIVKYEDTSAKLTFDQIRSPVIAAKFITNGPYPTTNNQHTTYWYRITINHDKVTKNNWLLEFYDQTIDDITVYSPNAYNTFTVSRFGSGHPFTNRLYQHKNFSVNIDNDLYGVHTYYSRRMLLSY